MAVPGLDSRRFWDERYPLENVETILKEGHFRPANGLHPALTHLPHTALLKLSDLMARATGNPMFEVFDSRGDFSPTSYLICRLLQTLLGVGSIWLLFLVGRRLGGERVGLLAAFFMAVVPWHVRQSATLKSDIVLIFFLVLTLYLSLRAISRPTLGRYLAAGAGVGLALSSKFNGGPIALPLVFGTLVSRDRSLRTFLYLVGAGVASVVVFLAINPYVVLDFGIYQDSFGRTLRVYERHGVMQGVESKWALLAGAVGSILSAAFHGPVVGALALLGLGWIVIRSWRDFRSDESLLGWSMVIVFVIAYPVLYVLSTSNPSPHNWLPLTPFVSLLAARVVLDLWDRVRRWPLPAATVVGTLAVIVLLVAPAWGALRFTYQNVVPTTGFIALEHLTRELRRPAGRTVVAEHDFGLWRQTNYRKANLALTQVLDLSALAPELLNRFDAEVFPESRLAATDVSRFYNQRLARVNENRVLRVEPTWFRSWGPALVVLLHPLKPAGKPTPGVWKLVERDGDLYRATFPSGLEPTGIVSFEFGLPGRQVEVEVRAGPQTLRTITFRAPRHYRHQTTPRFRMTPEVLMQLRRPVGSLEIPFAVKRWRRAQRPQRQEDPG